MLFLIYLLSIRRTIGLYQQNGELQRQLEMADRAPDQLRFYKAEADRLRKILRLNETSGEIKEEILRATVSNADSNGVLFKNLLEPAVYSVERVKVETYEVILQGDYVGLLKTLYGIEENLQSGKVVSVKFGVEKKQRARTLLAHIYIQTSELL